MTKLRKYPCIQKGDRYCHHDGPCDAKEVQQMTTEPIGATIIRDTPMISAHALAAAELLQQVVDRLHAGVPPEDLGADVQRFGAMMERKI